MQTPSTLQLWLDFFQSIVSSIAYPVAIVAVLAMFRAQLARLFDRITSGEGEVPGGSFKLTMDNATSDFATFAEEIKDEVGSIKQELQTAQQSLRSTEKWGEAAQTSGLNITMEELQDRLDNLSSYTDRFRRTISERVNDLSELEYGMLLLVNALITTDQGWGGSVETNDIVVNSGVDQSTVKELLSSLNEKGYIERYKDLFDNDLYSLSEKSKTLLSWQPPTKRFYFSPVKKSWVVPRSYTGEND